MQRIIIVYGAVAGVVGIGNTILWLTLFADQDALAFLEWLGYLVMLVTLSVIFVGIKRYRDRELGGVIKFATAMLIGTGIAVVASTIYVVVWEVYLAVTDYTFIDSYTQYVVAAKQAAGVDAMELQKTIAGMERLRTQYADPLFRVPMTLVEILPLGLLISLISAAILRKSEILPASHGAVN
jgi:hypothetical protein